MDSCHQNNVQDLNPGRFVPALKHVARRQGLPDQLREHIRALGPMPKTCLEIFVDLGLSNQEIAHYFDVPKTSIAKLCRIWSIRD